MLLCCQSPTKHDEELQVEPHAKTISRSGTGIEIVSAWVSRTGTGGGSW